MESTTARNDEDRSEERQELRPGLTMIKRRTLKEDGRYLLYFDFETAPEPDRPAD